MTATAGILAALTLIAAWFGGAIGAYFKKKGENFATHEDLEPLVEQMRAVTEATKTIEAAIGEKIWDRQRHWELKRDGLFAILETLGEADDAMVTLASTSKGSRDKNPAFAKAQQAKVPERIAEWLTAMNRFDAKRRIASLICTMETVSLLQSISRQMRESTPGIVEGNIHYSDIMPSLQRAIVAATVAARKELGLPPLSDPQADFKT